MIRVKKIKGWGGFEVLVRYKTENKLTVRVVPKSYFLPRKSIFGTPNLSLLLIKVA